MLKNVLNVNGVKKLDKKAQEKINGGVLHTNCDDIQGCDYGGYWSPTWREGVVLVCCAGSPDN